MTWDTRHCTFWSYNVPHSVIFLVWFRITPVMTCLVTWDTRHCTFFHAMVLSFSCLQLMFIKYLGHKPILWFDTSFCKMMRGMKGTEKARGYLSWKSVWSILIETHVWWHKIAQALHFFSIICMTFYLCWIKFSHMGIQCHMCGI